MASGYETMRGYAIDTPSAFVRGFADGQALGLPHRAEPMRVVAVGMGASGIVADLARSVIDAEAPADLTVVRSPSLPLAVGPRSQVLLTSYSGNTWETIRAYEAAGRARAGRTVVTSGGALAERAERDKVPVLLVPPGLPPRSAIGALLGGTLGILDPLFPESNEGRVRRMAEALRPAVGRWAAPRGRAAGIARSLGTRRPHVYAASSFVPLARRWKTQIEENAKRLAQFDEVPDLLHNALVGWDALPAAEARRCAVVLLDWREEDPNVRASAQYLDRLLRSRNVRTVGVELPSDDRLEALVGGIVLGDLVSLELARLRRVDPYPVEAIVRLKSRLRVGTR